MARGVRCLVVAGAAAYLAGPSVMSFVAPRVAPQTSGPKATYAGGEAQPADVADAVIDTSSPLRLGGAFLSIVAALAVAFMPMGEAQAAKSGGRMGGGGASRPPAVNKTIVNKTVINKTTVVQAPAPAPAPPVVVHAPPVVVAAPMMVAAPAPSLGDIVVGAAVQGAVSGMVSGAVHNAMGPGPSGGVSATDKILENQQRQDERQLDRQASQIEDLQRELMALKK
eukprot:TRINITY_DN113_c1_g1_i1.p1 TRINITY_DN113_c1_g1~~TRINITY_DN113_c1_g1_i1.p1  ORF type:complete len:225 (-),score=67.81 TRINITY_DN113_c1_g1_i1:153-827(-)